MKHNEGGPPADLIEFCRAEYERLVRFLSLYCGEPVLAEELAQESLTQACRHWNSVRAMDNPRAWLRRVGVNAANSHFRRRASEKRARARLEAEPAAVQIGDPADALAVRSALASLSRRQRAVLLMRFFDDLSIRDIAACLDCSENTVKSLVRRGLAALRETDVIREWKGALSVY